jgi:hypothetical protein
MDQEAINAFVAKLDALDPALAEEATGLFTAMLQELATLEEAAAADAAPADA